MKNTEMKRPLRIVANRSLVFAILVSFVAGFLPVATRGQQTPPYKNPRLSIDERVRDLLSRMTLEEKVAQMVSLWDERPLDKSRIGKEVPYGGDFSPELAKQRMPYGIGQFAR